MLDKNKKEMIDKIMEAVQSEATFIRENQELSLDEKMSKVDVLLDIHHFLREYEKNVEILNRYNFEHKFDREK